MDITLLVGCEESQTVAIAFRERGINAFSCDLQYCTGFRPDIHLQMDIFKAIGSRSWDGIILHPPCTFTCLSGNRHYFNSPKRKQGIEFAKGVWDAACSVCNNVALEQPMSVLGNYIGKKNQTIQPYEFGHGELKTTWLWLKGFPLLIPTEKVPGRDPRIFYMSASTQRGSLRSKTYPGIAAAMAQQWGDYLINQKK